MKNFFKSKNSYKEATKKINEIFDDGMDYSLHASKIARQLAFGEGALFWFFFNQNENLISIIIFGLSFLVLYFIFDVFQYIIGAWLNKNLGRTYESLHKKDHPLDPDEISRPNNMNSPIYFCYYTKFFMLIVSSFLLFSVIIIVERVEVHNGGQAIVGAINGTPTEKIKK